MKGEERKKLLLFILINFTSFFPLTGPLASFNCSRWRAVLGLSNTIPDSLGFSYHYDWSYSTFLLLWMLHSQRWLSVFPSLIFSLPVNLVPHERIHTAKNKVWKINKALRLYEASIESETNRLILFQKERSQTIFVSFRIHSHAFTLSWGQVWVYYGKLDLSIRLWTLAMCD